MFRLSPGTRLDRFSFAFAPESPVNALRGCAVQARMKKQVVLVVLAAFAAIAALLWMRPTPKPVTSGRDDAGPRVTTPDRRPPASASSTVAADGATPARANPDNSPAAIVARIANLKVSSNQPHSVRALILELENLKQAGVAALPAIREFLASGQDLDYDAGARRGWPDGRVPTEFAIPPSLRLGLLEVVKNIGGPAAEELLVHELKTTGRGVEVGYLAGALQEIAPDKYRDVSLAAARDLLAMPLAGRAPNPLDRSDREFLYGVLGTAGDRSYASQAQAQLLLPDGRVDRGALHYLQQALGADAVTVAAQAWQDPRVAPAQKEPLARVALNYAGTKAQADELFVTAINEPAFSPGQRQNLIEDLNEAGFADPKHLTPADLPLIEQRLALIEQLAPRAHDATNVAAFAEAKKDLLKMRDDVVRAPPPAPHR
jgi:hypothetical protein